MEVQAKNHLSEELNKVKMARIEAERSVLIFKVPKSSGNSCDCFKKAFEFRIYFQSIPFRFIEKTPFLTLKFAKEVLKC